MTSSYQFSSIGPDAYLICSQSYPSPPVSSSYTHAPVALGSMSPRRRQAQFTLQPLLTHSLPHEAGYTPSTPRFMAYKEMGSMQRRWVGNGPLTRVGDVQAKLHGMVSGWLCGI